jgi:NAD-dependent dihydropyrimidine dehydrogenase PreA subunit
MNIINKFSYFCEMCDLPSFSNEKIYFFLFQSKLRKVVRGALWIYFHKVRIIQVKNINEPVSSERYIIEPCECRLSRKQCSNRLDTCFKKQKNGNEMKEKLTLLSKEPLVRTQVNTGNFHFEICHCCSCCCFPIIIHKFLGFGLRPSGYKPIKDQKNCTNCRACYDVCPFSAIGADLRIDYQKCMGCGLCEEKCSANGIKLEKLEDIQMYIPNKLFSVGYLLIFFYFVKFLERLSVPEYSF